MKTMNLLFFLVFTLLGQNLMAQGPNPFPRPLYPPAGPIRMLKLVLTPTNGNINITTRTDRIALLSGRNLTRQPFNSYCIATPLSPPLPFSLNNGTPATPQEVGLYHYGTGVMVQNTGNTNIKLRSPDFDVELRPQESYDFSLTSDLANSDTRVVTIWTVIQEGFTNCRARYTTNDGQAIPIEVDEITITSLGAAPAPNPGQTSAPVEPDPSQTSVTVPEPDPSQTSAPVEPDPSQTLVTVPEPDPFKSVIPLLEEPTEPTTSNSDNNGGEVENILNAPIPTQ